jgi:hypothetical protein
MKVEPISCTQTQTEQQIITASTTLSDASAVDTCVLGAEGLHQSNKNANCSPENAANKT